MACTAEPSPEQSLTNKSPFAANPHTTHLVHPELCGALLGGPPLVQLCYEAIDTRDDPRRASSDVIAEQALVRTVLPQR